MKIIKALNDKDTWSIRIICRKCSTVLEIEESDVKVVNTAVAYAGEHEDYRAQIKCAFCYSFNDVTQEIPSGVFYKKLSERK